MARGKSSAYLDSLSARFAPVHELAGLAACSGRWPKAEKKLSHFILRQLLSTLCKMGLLFFLRDSDAD